MSILAFLSTQVIDTTTVGRAVMTAVDAAAARTAIGAQAADADLTALAALSGTNNIYYRSADDTWTSVTIGTGLTFTGGTLAASGGAGISSLNGLTDATQTFAVGTAGTDFAIVSASGVHTFNLPDASATARGVITTGTQTIAGAKTFSSAGTFSAGGTGLTVTGNMQCNGNVTGYRFYSNSQRITIFNNLVVGNAFAVEWSNTTGQDSGDTALIRDGVGQLGLRRGTTAHSYGVYNTYTSATSYERLNLGWSGNVCTIETQAGSGGGTLRGLKIGSAITSLLGFYGVTPVDQPATVADPTGGSTIDTEARTAIIALIDRLQELGLIA